MNPSVQKNIVILYTELAAYTIACLEGLSKKGVVIHVFHYPVNKEAPFKFDTSIKNKTIYYYNKQAYDANTLLEVISAINPELIYCAGWSDKLYLNVIKSIHKKSLTVLGFDNKWFGNIKQQLSIIYARLFITPYFNYAFVPGTPQQTFALKLGFTDKQILKGVYSADVDLFNTIYQKQQQQKQHSLPHRFIYIGRYYDFKGIKELWQAFIEWQNEQPNDWELWCLGTGDIEPLQHTQIKHLGFVQPKELEHYLFQTSVFILPSKFEPWGVVVHEMAASGFPLLLSNEIGAKEQFLAEGKNGFTFEAGNINSIKLSLKKTAEMSDSELMEMGDFSHQLAQSISPDSWAQQLIDVINTQ